MDNFNYQQLTINNPNFLTYINQGKIFNAYTNQQVGVTNDEYNKAVNLAKEYKKVLEDKGIIEKQKTPEEVQKELQAIISHQSEIMSKMADTIKAINEKVNNLEEKSNVEQANSFKPRK